MVGRMTKEGIMYLDDGLVRVQWMLWSLMRGEVMIMALVLALTVG